MPTMVELVSPEKLLLSRPVDMVVIPAAEGEIGVLGGHTPMIVLLRGGMIRLYDGAQVSERLFVAGGFAEITPERCTILANEAIPAAEVSRSVAQQRLAAAESAWQAVDKMDMPAIDTALDHLQSARAMLEAAEAA